MPPLIPPPITPLVVLATPPAYALDDIDASPKSVELPVDAFVTYSRIFTYPEVYPKTSIPLTLFEKPALYSAAADRSPKSVALPALAKVKYSITFNAAEDPCPPATIALVSEPKPDP